MSQPKTRPRNRRGEGGRLREDILRTAAELLDGGGEGAVTLRDIARIVGISAPSIYNHFADRDAILLAVVQQTFAELGAELGAALDRAGPEPVTRLRAFCQAYLNFSLERPQRYRILFGGLWNARQAPSVQPQAADLGLDVFALLVETLRACVRAGRSTSTDPTADAAALWVALHGLAQLRTAASLFPWPEELLERLTNRLAGLTPWP
ncbi:TetR/AcrR family transcriptional regulator [Deinococcus aetherius]|uniref:TetR/AcrR family transcriptional regulator n=1 Tax=Deinococcus aetherius TaxID=200252 RepID=UPI0022312619|nr:TetR/AcrR family transcriptional regulator [Deinococcus aetherius]